MSKTRSLRSLGNALALSSISNTEAEAFIKCFVFELYSSKLYREWAVRFTMGQFEAVRKVQIAAQVVNKNSGEYKLGYKDASRDFLFFIGQKPQELTTGELYPELKVKVEGICCD